MKLDDASKVAALTSTFVAMIVSVAAYLGNRQVQSLDAKIQQINIAAKSFDEAKAQYVATAKLGVEYGAPLARSFALRVLDRAGSDVQRDSKIMIPTNSLSDQILGDWRQRKGLMTGQACQKEGLKARQIALLQIKNHGSVSADDVVLIAKRGEPTNTDANGRWHAVGASGAPVAYADLGNIVDKWSDTEIAIGTLMGSDVPSDQARTVEVVLASVSGTTDFYGPILVPRRLTWTDPIKKERRVLDLGLSYFRTALLGAEIGSLSSACK